MKHLIMTLLLVITSMLSGCMSLNQSSQEFFHADCTGYAPAVYFNNGDVQTFESGTAVLSFVEGRLRDGFNSGSYPLELQSTYYRCKEQVAQKAGLGTNMGLGGFLLLLLLVVARRIHNKHGKDGLKVAAIGLFVLAAFLITAWLDGRDMSKYGIYLSVAPLTTTDRMKQLIVKVLEAIIGFWAALFAPRTDVVRYGHTGRNGYLMTETASLYQHQLRAASAREAVRKAPWMWNFVSAFLDALAFVSLFYRGDRFSRMNLRAALGAALLLVWAAIMLATHETATVATAAVMIPAVTNRVAECESCLGLGYTVSETEDRSVVDSCSTCDGSGRQIRGFIRGRLVRTQFGISVAAEGHQFMMSEDYSGSEEISLAEELGHNKALIDAQGRVYEGQKATMYLGRLSSGMWRVFAAALFTLLLIVISGDTSLALASTPLLVVTHKGRAHLDEFVACALLLAQFEGEYEVRIERRDPTQEDLDNPETFVVDQGGAHEPLMRNFDHHQLDGGDLCAYRLVADWLHLDEDASVVIPWWTYRSISDHRGAKNANLAVGLSGPTGKTRSPLEEYLLDQFSKRTVIAEDNGMDHASDPFWEMMLDFGWDLTNTIRTRGPLVAHYMAELEHGYNAELAMFAIDEEVDAVAMGIAREVSGKDIAATISRSSRGNQWSLFRYEDDPRYDFRKVDGLEDVVFAHGNGFMAAVNPEAPYSRALELLRKAFIPALMIVAIAAVFFTTHISVPEVISAFAVVGAIKPTMKDHHQWSIDRYTEASVQGLYTPKFFDKFVQFSKVLFETVYDEYEEDPIGDAIRERDYSLAYLRDGELRVIRAYDAEGKLVKPTEFMRITGLRIKGGFKPGKRLSRTMRLVKFGEHVAKVAVFRNTDMVAEWGEQALDGISLISQKFCLKLGVPAHLCKPGMGHELTYVHSKGQDKPHCIVSKHSKYDLIFFDDGTKDIFFDGHFVSLEAKKLSVRMSIDVQTLINGLHAMPTGLNNGAVLDPENLTLLTSAEHASHLFLDDLADGSALQSYDNLDADAFGTPEGYMLANAARHQVDHTLPGIFRALFGAFKKQMVRWTGGDHKKYRVPAPGARGYVRVDLRDHDENGNFVPRVVQGETELDEYGNWWVHPADMPYLCDLHGGADQDDMFAFLPLGGDKCLVWRSPNQFGELRIYTVRTTVFDGSTAFRLLRDPEIREITQWVEAREEETKEEVARRIYNQRARRSAQMDRFKRAVKDEWSEANLAAVWTRIKKNSASIGVAANAEMVRESIIARRKQFAFLREMFAWEFEPIIDSQVKDNDPKLLARARKSMLAIQDFFAYIVAEEIPVPEAAIDRIPPYGPNEAGELVELRSNAVVDKNHPLDQLLDAMDAMVADLDLQVMGNGTMHPDPITGEIRRTPGVIDEFCVTDDQPFFAKQHPAMDIALEIKKTHDLVWFEAFRSIPEGASEEERQEILSAARPVARNVVYDYLNSLSSHALRVHVVREFAFLTYSDPEGYIHDSVCWMPDLWETKVVKKQTRRIGHAPLALGTGRYMLQALIMTGQADHIEYHNQEPAEADAPEGAWDVRIEREGRQWALRYRLEDMLPVDGSVIRAYYEKEEMETLGLKKLEIDMFTDLVVRVRTVTINGEKTQRVYANEHVLRVDKRTPIADGNYTVEMVSRAFNGKKKAAKAAITFVVA